MADICLIEHFDAIKFSEFLKKISPNLRPLARIIYDSAEKYNLYCPEIKRCKDIIIFNWVNEKKVFKIVISESKDYVRFFIKDDEFSRHLQSPLNKERIDQMILELSLFIN